MPKTPMDYSKTIIYKIVCNDLSIKDCYVGHTTDMTKRKCSHKFNCNNEKNKSYNRKIYQIIRENGGWDNWSMLLVEKFPCNDKRESEKREREVYEELEAKMNTLRPYITQEETKQYHKQYKKQYHQEHKEEKKHYNKQYRQEHKQYHEEYHKKYREEHKDILNEKGRKYRQEHQTEINEKRKEKAECEFCSKLLSNRNISRHHKTCKSKPVKE